MNHEQHISVINYNKTFVKKRMKKKRRKKATLGKMIFHSIVDTGYRQNKV